jgi:Zn-dependent protease with chaperone function
VNLRQFSQRLLCLLISLLFITSAAAATPRDEDEEALMNYASLSVKLDAEGSIVAFLSVGFSKASSPELEQKLNEALGVRLQKYQPDGMKEFEVEIGENEDWQALFGRAENAFDRSGLMVSGRFNLAPLLDELRKHGVTDLSLILLVPQTTAFASLTGATQCSPQINFYYCSRINLATASTPIVAFTYGYRLADVLWKSLPLVLFLLVPVLLTLWMRRAALRIREADPSASWFGYFRFLNLSIMATWLLWLPLYSLVDPENIFRYLSDTNVNDAFSPVANGKPALSIGFEIFKLCLYMIPPALVTVLCHLLSHKVFTRVRGMEWSPGEVVRQAMWMQAAALVPIMFVLTGLTSISRHPSLGAACFILAFISWQICARLSNKAQNLTPQALTTGELRDRIFALAERAGVPLKQIYILPAGKGRMVNAFARSDNSMLLTDSLLRHLSGREIEGIVAHELAHLKERHPRSLGMIFAVTIVVATILTPQLASAINLERWAPALFSIAIGTAMLVTHYVSRGFERHADALAITLTGDPESFITGLAKLARLNLMPVKWGAWDEKWTTHPSTQHRIQRVAEYGGVPMERVRELLSAPQAEAVVHTETQTATQTTTQPATQMVTETIETEKVFNTTFKTNMAQRVMWAVVAVVSGTPVLLAWLMQRPQMAGVAPWLAYVCGIVAAFAFYQLVRNFLAVWGYKALREGLHARMEREGFKTKEGFLVGFAPSAELRIYENQYVWDTGFLFLTDDRLCYVGEETRFALNRAQVVDVYLGAGPVDWIKRQTLYVRWRDEERNAEGTFYLYSGEVRSLWQARRKVLELYKQVRSWVERETAFPVTSEPLNRLNAPAYGSVTSISPATLLSFGLFVNSLIMLSVFTSVLGVALSFSWAGIGYALALTVSICLLDNLPRFLHRETANEVQASQTMDNVNADELSDYQPGVLVETET